MNRGLATKLFCLLALAAVASPAWAQPRSSARAGSALPDPESRNLRAWFAGGIGIQFNVESTGANSPVFGNGGITVSDAGIFRSLRDKDGNILFAYAIEAVADPAGAINIRITPIGPEFNANGRIGKSSGPIPTVSGLREFAGLKRGQAVRLDVLTNASTGETVYDILRPTTEAPPSPDFRRGADSVPARDELSFRDIAVKVNGRAIPPPEGWLTGACARLHIPGLGAYYLSVNEPKLQIGFRHAAYVNQKKLDFDIDGDHIEIQSQNNALTKSIEGVAWVWHDPNFKTARNPAVADLSVADALEYLLSRK